MIQKEEREDQSKEWGSWGVGREWDQKPKREGNNPSLKINSIKFGLHQ